MNAVARDEGIRADDPSSALPRPSSERPLPKILDHEAVDALFAEIERRKVQGGTAALRLSAFRPRRPISRPRRALISIVR